MHQRRSNLKPSVLADCDQKFCAVYARAPGDGRYYNGAGVVAAVHGGIPSTRDQKLADSVLPSGENWRTIPCAVEYFVRGLIIGFSIAAPVGPIGILCIRRSLADGVRTGLVLGLGAATADAMYGVVAGFGLTFVSDLLLGHRTALGLGGGAFLCYLGAKTFFAKPADQPAAVKGSGLLAAYFPTVLLTLTNPMTILSFVAVFAGFGLAGSTPNYSAASALVAGVFGGSALWWVLLSGGVSLYRSRLTPAWMQAINRVSGAVIFAFGLYPLMRLAS